MTNPSPISLSDEYRLYLSHPTLGRIEFFPLNDTLEFERVRYEDECFFRKNLITEICISNHKDVNAFDLLYELEKVPCTCPVVDIEIDKYCEDEWKEWYKGRIKLAVADWDITNCKVNVSPETVDEYTCLLDNWNKPRNILAIEDKVTLDTIIGDIECVTVTGFNGPPPPPPGFGWTPITTITTYESDISQGPQGPEPNDNDITQIVIRYCREVFVGTTAPQVGAGWIFVSGDGAYYRSITVTNCVTTLTQSTEQDLDNAGGSASDIVLIEVYTEQCTYLDFEADNGVKLMDVFNYLIPCDEPFCSNFFTEGPQTNYPNNTAYTHARNTLSNIVLFQTSDVIRAGASSNSSEANCTFKEIWDDLKKLGLCLFYDEENQCYRIEHCSAVTQKGCLNFSDPKYLSCIKHKYKRSNENLPSQEIYLPRVKTEGVDFNQSTIRYLDDCIPEDSEPVEISFEKIDTDFQGLYNSEEYKDDVTANQGLMFVALDSNNLPISGQGALSNETILNHPLAWSTIVECYLTYKKPLCDGYVNGENYRIFDSVNPLKELESFSVELCCEDTFKVTGLETVKLPFGEIGYIESIKSISPSPELHEIKVLLR